MLERDLLKKALLEMVGVVAACVRENRLHTRYSVSIAEQFQRQANAADEAGSVSSADTADATCLLCPAYGSVLVVKISQNLVLLANMTSSIMVSLN